MTILENNLLGITINDLPKLLPGLLAAATLTWLSFWLSDFIGVRLMGFDKSPRIKHKSTKRYLFTPERLI